MEKKSHGEDKREKEESRKQKGAKGKARMKLCGRSKEKEMRNGKQGGENKGEHREMRKGRIC